MEGKKMTDADKKMKKYIRSVQRRLNLPKEIRDRVTSDLVSSIQARREAGQEDDAIFRELGTPKKAAADLNEQMKEFAYRKSPWRFLFLALAVLSAGWIVMSRLFLYFGMILETLYVTFTPNLAASIGVIGGADGPTAIFVAAPAGFDWDVAIVTVVLVIGILGFLRLRKCGQK